jgi:hypothetical protein
MVGDDLEEVDAVLVLEVLAMDLQAVSDTTTELG